ncbi:glycerophosphodiester phosphodiesterase [Candidatus Saccharibacteria bacterium]|nr:glycerophosphodiester phosphodiesterase [Candidatus Saccharibacteria bacterium]
MKTTIIGHRGAAGLVTENTLASFKKAEELGVDFIELDTRKTQDGQLVAFHDRSTQRLCTQNLTISRANYAELSRLTFKDSQSHIPLLEDVLQHGSSPLIIELKEYGLVEALVRLLHTYTTRQVVVASFKLRELQAAKTRLANPLILLSGPVRALYTIRLARKNQFNGVGLGFWLLNPVSYWLAKRSGVDLYVFTVDNTWLLKLIAWLYPRVAICTNRPDKLLKLRGDTS